MGFRPIHMGTESHNHHMGTGSRHHHMGTGSRPPHMGTEPPDMHPGTGSRHLGEHMYYCLPCKGHVFHIPMYQRLRLDHWDFMMGQLASLLSIPQDALGPHDVKHPISMHSDVNTVRHG